MVESVYERLNQEIEKRSEFVQRLIAEALAGGK